MPELCSVDTHIKVSMSNADHGNNSREQLAKEMAIPESAVQTEFQYLYFMFTEVETSEQTGQDPLHEVQSLEGVYNGTHFLEARIRGMETDFTCTHRLLS